jgi:H+-translocating NAD(P) transhydrogenase subunit alpha
MTAELLAQITVLVLAAVIGFELISRVPSLLHTPLMSATNAIHGVVLVGAMVVLVGPGGAATTVLGFIAVVLATINVVGGFVVTGRMLEMFRSRAPRRDRGS